MAIRKPGRVLLRGLPFSFMRTRLGGSGRRTVDTQIALVPLVDFLITLVVFLLVSFSASSDLRADDSQLPEARNTVDLEYAPVIVVNQSIVAVDGLRIADTHTLMEAGAGTRLDLLVDALGQKRNLWALLRPREPFPGAVTLQVDRRVDFRVVRKVLASAAQAGYPNVSFAVVRARRQ